MRRSGLLAVLLTVLLVSLKYIPGSLQEFDGDLMLSPDNKTQERRVELPPAGGYAVEIDIDELALAEKGMVKISVGLFTTRGLLRSAFAFQARSEVRQKRVSRVMTGNGISGPTLFRIWTEDALTARVSRFTIRPNVFSKADVARLAVMVGIWITASALAFQRLGMRRTQLPGYAVACVFILLLLLPQMQAWTRLIPEFPADEQRFYNRFPVANGLDSPHRLVQQSEQAFNEAFGLRSWLVRWNSAVDVFVFGQSPIDSYILGIDNWFYYSSSLSAFLPKPIQKAVLTSVKAEAMVSGLTRLSQMTAAQGCPMIVTVPPDKPAVYPEYLPRRYRTHQPATLDIFAEVARRHPEMMFLDVRDSVRAGKVRLPVFFKVDGHWNSYGGLLAYLKLQSGMKATLPLLPELKETDYHFKTRQGHAIVWDIPVADLLEEKFIDIRRRSDRPLPDRKYKVLIIHDSFAHAMLPFFREAFAEVVLHHHDQGAISADYLARIKPDLVVFERVERGLVSDPSL